MNGQRQCGYIYTMEYYSAIKKDKVLPFATTWMDLEGIMLSKISQRKKNTIWFHLYMESEKLINEQKSTDRPISTENKVMVARREGV